MSEFLLKIEAWAFQLDKLDVPGVSHPADAARASQIADPARRLRYKRGRRALRRVLAGRLGGISGDVAFHIADGGKPAVPGCEFSISHSGPWLVVVVSDAAVGVDIETQRPRVGVLKLAERFFSGRDFQFLRQVSEADRDHAFIRQWVAKEAALKCEGVGLALHLHKAEYRVGDAPHVCWDGSRFSIHEFELADGTPGAVAWRGDGKARIQWRDASKLNVS